MLKKSFVVLNKYFNKHFFMFKGFVLYIKGFAQLHHSGTCRARRDHMPHTSHHNHTDHLTQVPFSYLSLVLHVPRHY